MDKAAAAAHTYFQANPEHVEMGQNLEQYKDLQGVREEHFVDREARPHQVGNRFSFFFRSFFSGWGVFSFILSAFLIFPERSSHAGFPLMAEH